MHFSAFSRTVVSRELKVGSYCRPSGSVTTLNEFLPSPLVDVNTVVRHIMIKLRQMSSEVYQMNAGR
jgi:hypothetical protein